MHTETGFSKVSAELPIEKLRNGKSAHPALVYLWFVVKLAQRQRPDGIVEVRSDYSDIMNGTGITRTSTVVACLKHLAEVGALSYLGVSRRSGKREYQLCSSWCAFGPGRPGQACPEDGSKNRCKNRTDLSRCDSSNLYLDEKLLQDPVQFSSSKTADLEARNPYQIFEDEGFGPLTLWVGDELGDLIDSYGEEAVKEAMKIAVLNNVRKLNYVRGVLKKQQSRSRPYSDYGDIEENEPEELPRLEPETSADPAALTIWQTTCNELQLQMPRETFDTWLRHTRLLDYADGVYTIGAINTQACAWLEQRLKKVILPTLKQVAGREVDITFTVMP